MWRVSLRILFVSGFQFMLVTAEDRCTNPVKASGDFLAGIVTENGPCKTSTATDRFVRFSEWLEEKGGWVNPKVIFRRGEYVDELTGEPRSTVGGLFLRAGENLVQGEILFEVPESVHFCDGMVEEHIPLVPRFQHLGMYRLWLSFGLASLIKHHHEVVGPWAALLPDISYHPTLWSPSHLRELWGTQAFSIISSAIQYIESGCAEFPQELKIFRITCEEAMRGHAILLSRSFGLSMRSGDSGVAIPLGFDFMNHNPNTMSGIIHLENKRSIFLMHGFTLGSTRELYNNYGQHAFGINLALYGFTAPDTKDELVIHATLDGLFDGEVYKPLFGEICPRDSQSNYFQQPLVQDTGANPSALSYVCDAGLAQAQLNSRRWDPLGYFRLHPQDIVEMHAFDSAIKCANLASTPLWWYLRTKLKQFEIGLNPTGEFVLGLNTPNGVIPNVMFPQAIWLATCALSPFLSGPALDKFLFEATTCPPGKPNETIAWNPWPLHTSIKNLALHTVMRMCDLYETQIMGGLMPNLVKWIAYRNARVVKTSPEKQDPKSSDIHDLLENLTNDNFHMLLDKINIGKATVFSTQTDTRLELLSSEYETLDIGDIYQAEEIYKYKMQTVYMMAQKCRLPLSNFLSTHDFKRTIDEFLPN